MQILDRFFAFVFCFCQMGGVVGGVHDLFVLSAVVLVALSVGWYTPFSEPMPIVFRRAWWDLCSWSDDVRSSETKYFVR